MKKYYKYIVPAVLSLMFIGYFIFINIFPRNEIVEFKSTDSNDKQKPDAIAVIVPHLGFAADKREELLSNLQSEDVKTVVLISSDHSNSGADITTTSRLWNLNSGLLESDKEKTKQLVDSGLAVENEEIISAENGITNILPEIQKYYPNSKIVPIIIKEDVELAKTISLKDKLKDICRESCLVMASIDFSHYQPGVLAELHDDLALRAIYNTDEALACKAEVDSNPALAFVILWAKEYQSEKFNLFEHSNSGKEENSSSLESVSYVMGHYSEGEKQVKEKSISFVFGGDMMTDRNVDYHFRDGKLMEVVKNLGNRVFWGSDITMVNLEGPVNDEPIVANNTANNLVFNMPPQTIDLLSYLHINLVSLANNHTLNDGNVGYERTKVLLNDKNITAIGHQNDFNSSSIARVNNGDMQVSIMTIDILANKADLTSKIKSEKELSDRVVVFPHWGEEYQTKHNLAQERLAHDWIDAGADLVIGSHPHVVQDAEIYKGHPIFYSLGNFIFDQDWSLETQKGLIIAGKFTDKVTEIIVLPTVSKKYQPELTQGVEKDSILNKFRKDLDMEECSSAYDCGKITLKY